MYSQLQQNKRVPYLLFLIRLVPCVDDSLPCLLIFWYEDLCYGLCLDGPQKPHVAISRAFQRWLYLEYVMLRLTYGAMLGLRVLELWI